MTDVPPPLSMAENLRAMAHAYRHCELGYIAPSMLLRIADELERLDRLTKAATP